MTLSFSQMEEARDAMKRWKGFDLKPEDPEVCKAYLALQADPKCRRVTARRLKTYLDSYVRVDEHETGRKISFYVVQKAKFPNAPPPSWAHYVMQWDQISKYDQVGVQWNWEHEWIVDKAAPLPNLVVRRGRCTSRTRFAQ